MLGAQYIKQTPPICRSDGWQGRVAYDAQRMRDRIYERDERELMITKTSNVQKIRR
jgi:hypothetical protein